MAWIRTMAAAAAVAALWGCQQMDGSGMAMPDGAEAGQMRPILLVADVQPAPAAPEGAMASGVSPVADIEAWTAGTTAVASNGDCELHIFREAGGAARAESICGGERSEAAGRWSVIAGGVFCYVWNTKDRANSCLTFEHTGDGAVAWKRVSGSSMEGEGNVRVYEGNVFDL